MGASYETNEFEYDEAEYDSDYDSEADGYYPEYDADYAPVADEAAELLEAATDSRRQSRGRSARRDTVSPSLGFVLPLGGGGIAPALSFPIGGGQSPFSLAVPLTGATSPPAPTPEPPVDPLLADSALLYPPLVVAEPYAPEAVIGRYTFDTDEASQWDETEAEYEVEDQESDETFGERLVAVADTLASDPQFRRLRSSVLLATLLEALGLAHGLSPLGMGSGHRPSASELYNAFVHGDSGLRPRHRFRAHYARLFAPIALPGQPLRLAELRPGDLVVRVARGENWGQISVIADARLLTVGELGGVPIGGYVPVIECGPLPRPRRANFARRLSDRRGATLPDTLVLRVRRGWPTASSEQAEIDEPAYPGKASYQSRLARGASGPAVREVQARLNRYSLQEVAAGRRRLDGYPLAEDGQFGAGTERAVRDFQKRQFPQDQSQWNGIVESKTREKLDSLGSATSAGVSSLGTIPQPQIVSDRSTAACSGPVTLLERFGHNQSTLLPDHRQIIEQLADQIVASQTSTTPVQAICLAGHTDETGDNTYNRTLGTRRSEAVRQGLMEAVQRRAPGLWSRLTIHSFTFGEERSIASNATTDGRARNRRVEVYLNMRSEVSGADYPFSL